jgi:hypothetical protein
LEKRKKKKRNNLIFHSIVLLSLPVLVVVLAFIVHLQNKALQSSQSKNNFNIVVVDKNKKEEVASSGAKVLSAEDKEEIEVTAKDKTEKEEKKVVHIDYSHKTGMEVNEEKNKSDTSKKDDVEKVNIPKVEENKKLNYKMGVSLAETLFVLPEDEIKTELDDIVSLGFGWIRVDFAWSSIQPNGRDEFFWDKTDRIIKLANERGLKVLPIITYTPYWARSGVCKETNRCAPDNPKDYGEFAKALAKRYSSAGVYAWEIWNEPNLGIFWKPSADPEYYEKLLKEAYIAIHGVNPSAIVLTGGLAPTDTKGISMNPREFIERLYASGGKRYFDAIGFHPYSFPLSPSQYNKTSAWSQMADAEWSLRSIMKENGDSAKKIWLTEYGAPTGGPGSVASSPSRYVWDVPDHVTESYQAEIFEDAVSKIKTYDWAGPMFWYSYKDLGTNKNDKENFFGIIRYDGSKKPVYFKMEDIVSD